MDWWFKARTKGTRLLFRLRRKPRETADFRRMVSKACEWTKSLQDRLKSEYRVGQYERYDWYQERGVIIFSTAGAPKLVADIQVVGTVSRITETWLWAWANTSLESSLARDSEHLRHIGEASGHEKLTTTQWRADEVDGWEMMSLQAHCTAAEGVYRTSKEDGFTFFTLKNVRWAADDEWYERAPTSA